MKKAKQSPQAFCSLCCAQSCLYDEWPLLETDLPVRSTHPQHAFLCPRQWRILPAVQAQPSDVGRACTCRPCLTISQVAGYIHMVCSYTHTNTHTPSDFIALSPFLMPARHMQSAECRNRASEPALYSAWYHTASLCAISASGTQRHRETLPRKGMTKPHHIWWLFPSFRLNRFIGWLLQNQNMMAEI